MYFTCSNGHDKVVQVLLEHDVQVNVQNKVSNLSFVHFKLSSATQFNNVTFVIKTQMNLIILFMKVLTVLKMRDGIILTTIHL